MCSSKTSADLPLLTAAPSGLCIRRDVTCDCMESLGKELSTRADDIGTNGGDAANGFNADHVISPIRLSDFGRDGAGEVALESRTAPSDRPNVAGRSCRLSRPCGPRGP